MGFCAWTGDAQNNPQMAMKSLSFKLRFSSYVSFEQRTRYKEDRILPPIVQVDEWWIVVPPLRLFNGLSKTQPVTRRIRKEIQEHKTLCRIGCRKPSQLQTRLPLELSSVRVMLVVY